MLLRDNLNINDECVYYKDNNITLCVYKGIVLPDNLYKFQTDNDIFFLNIKQLSDIYTCKTYIYWPDDIKKQYADLLSLQITKKTEHINDLLQKVTDAFNNIDTSILKECALINQCIQEFGGIVNLQENK